MYKLAAIFSGLLIAIMITFNGTLSNKTGAYFSIFIIHIVGLLTAIIIMIIKREKFSFKRNVPLYLFTGGAIGVFMVLFNNLCFNKLGASLTLSLGLLGQSIAAVIIDHFGLFGMEKHKFQSGKITGFVLIFLGIAVMMVY